MRNREPAKGVKERTLYVERKRQLRRKYVCSAVGWGGKWIENNGIKKSETFQAFTSGKNPPENRTLGTLMGSSWEHSSYIGTLKTANRASGASGAAVDLN